MSNKQKKLVSLSGASSSKQPAMIYISFGADFSDPYDI